MQKKEPFALLGVLTDRTASPPTTVYREAADWWIVSTISRPDFWFGNYVVLKAHPDDETRKRAWMLCKSLFPASGGYKKHILLWETIASDQSHSAPEEQELVNAEGIETLHRDVMLFEDAGCAKRREGVTGGKISKVVQNEEWRDVQKLLLGNASQEERSFLTWQLDQYRVLCEAGSGLWLRGMNSTGRAVSTLGIYVSARYARFQNVFTEPSSRGNGYASALIERAIAEVTKDRKIRSYVIVADRDSDAQRLYKRLGFRNMSTQHIKIRSAV